MNSESLRVADCATGRGLFAARNFATGDLILKLNGARYGREHPIHATESGANLLQTGWRTYILLEAPGVFANHSCHPNAGIRDNRLLVAIRPIAPGCQICFDYSTTMAENFWTMKCRCGEEDCRGIVTDFRGLPAEIRERYLAQGVVQGFIASKYRSRASTRATAAEI